MDLMPRATCGTLAPALNFLVPHPNPGWPDTDMLSRMPLPELFEHLVLRTFRHEQVAAALSANPLTLPRYLKPKAPKLFLASEPPGRGRGRRYVLLDVYILGVAAEIVGITRNLETSILATNNLLVQIAETDLENVMDCNDELTLEHPSFVEWVRSYADDPEVWNEFFAYRSLISPQQDRCRHAGGDWFLLSSNNVGGSYFETRKYNPNNTNYKNDEFENPLFVGSVSQMRFSGINCTWLFSRIDRQMAKILDEER